MTGKDDQELFAAAIGFGGHAPLDHNTGSASLFDQQPQLKSTLPQFTIYFEMGYPSHCCQRRGESVGWIGRFLFPFFRDHCKRSDEA